jgi:hypothetical protein
MRLVVPHIRDNSDSKTNYAVEKIHQIWLDSAPTKGAQLVFCDLSTPQPSTRWFSVYDDVRGKLIDRGIPAPEIAFMQDANDDAAKATLARSVREGKIRVLLGSTLKMGEGTNVQTRLVALHHLDAPLRPADIEQREGRIIRQGNQNEFVKIFRYVTEGSFDAYMWQTLETKCRFIAQVMTGDATVRRAEDVDSAALTYAEVKAIASGNPLVIEKATIDPGGSTRSSHIVPRDSAIVGDDEVWDSCLDRARVILGCFQPGQTSSVYGDALNRLADRLHYLNSSSDKGQESTRFWFDTRANLRREMEDRKRRFEDRNEVRGKIAEVLKKLAGNISFCDGTHIFTPHADVSDDGALRLVVRAEARFFRLKFSRLSALSIDVFVEHCVPAGGKIVSQFVPRAAVVKRQTAGHDKEVFIVILPQPVDDLRHQLQNSASSLETVDRRPVFIQSIEALRMDRISLEQALVVTRLLSVRRQFRPFRQVCVCESSTNGLACFRVSHLGLEEPAANNLERFFRGDWFPERLDAAKRLFQGAECGDEWRRRLLDLTNSTSLGLSFPTVPVEERLSSNLLEVHLPDRIYFGPTTLQRRGEVISAMRAKEVAPRGEFIIKESQLWSVLNLSDPVVGNGLVDPGAVKSLPFRSIAFHTDDAGRTMQHAPGIFS